MIHVAKATCIIIKNRLSNINVQLQYTHWNYIPSGTSGTLPVPLSLGSFSWCSVPHISFMKKEISELSKINWIYIYLTCFINLEKVQKNLKTFLVFVCNCHLSVYVVLLAFYKSNIVVILPYISKWSKLVIISGLWIVQRQEKLTSLLHFEDSDDISILRCNTTITKGGKVLINILHTNYKALLQIKTTDTI